jgi:hypothetical protein
MTVITILYVLLMIAAVAWLVWKVKLHLEKEKDRESHLDEQMLYDETFKSYLEDMKKQKQKDRSGGRQSGLDEQEQK